ncbi:MAG TPA: winged helix-turn-helix transcriptional regulator [Candidatus Dormibacteraeota bacterium]|nr:winged helix-turn-helix transcriptional regulator [Candidatus Dormibacteraeota bacterium]
MPYTDLVHGFPGIATNMLAGRLRRLTKAQVVERVHIPEPTPASLFRLAHLGLDL